MKTIMKKIIFVILLIFPIGVLAEGYISVSPTSITIEEGSSKTINITAFNAIGDVSISTSNAGIATINTFEWSTGMVEEQQTKSGSITITGNSVGSATLVFTVDGSTFDEEDVSGQRIVSVTVVAKPTPEPTPEPTPTPTPSSNEKKEDNKSKNNNLKELSVDGYKVEKVDNNNYTLIVSNDVKEINVKAVSEDSKATVKGDGKHEIKDGENNIEIIITSEAGVANKINLKVTKKDVYTIEDLDEVLKNDKVNNIKINGDTKLNIQDIQKIQNSKKEISFDYYDKDRLLYSIIIDGTKDNKIDELLTTIIFDSDKKKEISELTNSDDGLYISFKQDTISSGIKVKLYVGNKYQDKEFINIYSYDEENNKMNLIQNKVQVEKGYITFVTDTDNNYLLTKDEIINEAAEDVSDNKSVNDKKSSDSIFIYIIVLIICVIAIIVGVVVLLLKKKKDKKNKILDIKDIKSSNDNINLN